MGTEYFKHGIYSPFFPLQNAVCFIILTYLVPVLFTFYIQGVLKLKKNNSGAKRLKYELKKKIGKFLTSKSVGPGPLFYEKRIYRAAVSQRLRNTGIDSV